MTPQKLPISDFLTWSTPHANPDKGPDQWGYVMGATGQTPRTAAELQDLVSRAYGEQWKSYYNPDWIGHRVFDCNGLIEGYYKEITGTSINTYARYNFRDWCSRKGTIDTLPQMPGVAVFKGKSTANISHVGFLFQKTGDGDRDWSVVEAKGYKYGVVITSLAKDSNWKWWGVMDKFFSYGDAAPTPAHDLQYGDGMNDPREDVRELQRLLVRHGFGALLGIGGIDGEFGSCTRAALKAFQAANALEPSGVCTPETWQTLRRAAPIYRLTIESEDLPMLTTVRTLYGGTLSEVGA